MIWQLLATLIQIIPVSYHLNRIVTFTETSPKSKEISNDSEFDEFDVKEEATLETKNYIYTLLADAHYQKK